MRGFIVGSLAVILLFVGIPLFLNYEKTGEPLGGENSVITAVFSGWIGLADEATKATPESPMGSGRF